MHHWYVIQTKPHKQNDVGLLLNQAQIENFNPKIKEVSYRGLKPVYQLKPLFPAYLFINIDFSKGELIHMIKYTRGVSKILCAQEKPIPLAPEIITTLKQRVNPQGIIEKPAHFNAGDSIRVKKGMLKDLVGILEKPCSADERVIVLLKLVNYEMKATLHWSEVERIRAA